MKDHEVALEAMTEITKQRSVMAHEHAIRIFNKRKYELEQAVQTGAALKHPAGLPLSDVLFLQRPATTKSSATTRRSR